MNEYRCETCKNVGCHIHPENKSSINYDTGVRYDHFALYDSFMRKMGCASHSDFQSEREKVLIHSFEVMKPGFPCITRRELAYNDISEDEDDFTRLHIPVEVGDEIRIYRQKAGE